MKDSQEGAQLKHQDKSATDVLRWSCIKLVATMHFLAAGEEKGCATGHLSEVDGSGSKIKEGVAVLFRGVIEIDVKSGSTGVSSHWANNGHWTKGLVGMSGHG